MILNLAPSRSYHLDTISSLNFANRTKKIEVREIENESTTKGCSRSVPTVTGLSMQRQPLRPLSSAVHNTAVGIKSLPQKGSRTVKSFSVYSDKLSASAHITNDTASGLSPLKRPPDIDSSAFGRPAKRRSPERMKRVPGTISRATIEDMIEKKVTDILAARTLDQTSAAPVPEISEEVQRRLEMLEQKVGSQDDSRGQGLSFLLMAKQHAVRGEDKSALRMYLLAQAYFPDNAKLESKIERLQTKLEETTSAGGKGSGTTPDIGMSGDSSRLLGTAVEVRDLKEDERRQGRYGDGNYYRDSNEKNESACDSDDSFRYRPNSKKTIQKTATRKIRHEEGTTLADSPRTKRLLEIVNSQDVGQLRLLRGIGAKKAEAIIEALCNGEDGEERGPVIVRNLSQLGRLRGVGVRTVENMRSGLEQL